MSSKILNIDPFGEVKFSWNRRLLHLKLKVREGKLYVSIPSSYPPDRILDFIKSKTEWIVKQQEAHKSTLMLFDVDTKFSTKFHKLIIERNSRKQISAIKGNGKVQVFIPWDYDCKKQEFQLFIRKVLTQVMRVEAKQYLPARVKELAESCGLKYRNVFIKDLSSRWGSCSSENNINLNLHLMRLPDRLIDYVLYHELTHLVERNHSSKFWSLLEKFCPKAKILDKELKAFRATF